MKILITGGSGLLGKALYETKPKDYDTALTWYDNINAFKANNGPWYSLDVRDKAKVFQLFEEIKPDAVIHCAAVGSVDYAEKHYQEVKQVNRDGVNNILRAAKEYNSRIVYISSNAVYNGNDPPYSETSPRNPINLYGKLKVQAERLVMDSKSWTVIRPFLLYGWPYPGGRSNWAKTIVETLREGKKELKLVHDTLWQPTYVIDCAQFIWSVIRFDYTKPITFDNQVYNVAGEEKCTLYEFGLKVARIFDLDERLLKPVTSDYFPKIANRPRNTSYDLSKIHDFGMWLSGIDDGLGFMRDSEDVA